MARSKQAAPKEATRWVDDSSDTIKREVKKANGAVNGAVKHAVDSTGSTSEPGVAELAMCVVGIYGLFLTWGVLQERITTTPYKSAPSPLHPKGGGEIFTATIVINTIQSALATISGYLYHIYSSRNLPRRPSIFPTISILGPLILVSCTQSLASPFGYASLKHVGYVTYVLAKSCKLVPVMFLHVTLFRRKYPLYKYAVVALVTAGVAVFTLQSSGKKSAKKMSPEANATWGLLLLSVNLLFDGLTNSTQDYINTAFKPFSGAQMMTAQNLMSTVLQSLYLIGGPFILPVVGPFLGLAPASIAAASSEFHEAAEFIQRHPQVLKDILAFALCGALGQVFIFYTLNRFSSLLLVTITVTRKMLTMLLSVLWFGHQLSLTQWLGVGLVFGGVAGEAIQNRREKARHAKKD